MMSVFRGARGRFICNAKKRKRPKIGRFRVREFGFMSMGRYEWLNDVSLFDGRFVDR